MGRNLERLDVLKFGTGRDCELSLKKKNQTFPISVIKRTQEEDTENEITFRKSHVFSPCIVQNLPHFILRAMWDT